MWAMSITGHSISQWLPCPVPSWVPNTIGTWGGNSVKKTKTSSLTPMDEFEVCFCRGFVFQNRKGKSISVIIYGNSTYKCASIADKHTIV